MRRRDELALLAETPKLVMGTSVDRQTVAPVVRQGHDPFARARVVLFEDDPSFSETGFEACLWERLQSLSDKDDWLGQQLDPRVSADPENPHFSLSFGGQAFFVVGLHPAASRPARRFERPALVFNLHDQFEQLRD